MTCSSTGCVITLNHYHPRRRIDRYDVAIVAVLALSGAALAGAFALSRGGSR